ncbi:MAG TPA: glycosyl hydrolase family 65 protein [Planctomycetota bacterium]|nr:glycosyl hydrolase family 65 protein [Planctomycetota bacterium]
MELERGRPGTRTRAVAAPAPPTTRTLPRDTAWVLVQAGFDARREHEVESRFTTANGFVGVRGSLFEGSAASAPATFLAGVFTTPPGAASVPELFVAPDWTRVRLGVGGRELSLAQGETLEHVRRLDLRDEVLARVWRQRDRAGRIVKVEEQRAASIVDRGLLLQSIAVTSENSGVRISFEEDPLGALAGALIVAPGHDGGGVWTFSLRVPGTETVVALALASTLRGAQEPVASVREGAWRRRWDVDAEVEGTHRLDRFVAFATSRDHADPARAARESVERALARGFAAALGEHVRASRARWKRLGAELDGHEPDLRALRFAEHSLLASANPDDDRVSIGARGLTGSSYKGHVFWDTEIYVVPFFALTDPPVARTLLAYRHHTLPAARARAAENGFRGALYAWESAADGRDTTPPFALAPDGEVVPILSGRLEHHISADVAYAIWTYWQATGDDAFLIDQGAEIILETARFWASRGALEGDGRFHFRNVIGPDEYHERVDDDAFTNGMAQWNLERGAEVSDLLASRWPDRRRGLAARIGLKDDEPRTWRDLARATYTGFDPRTGLIEQFQGFFGLEEVAFADHRTRRVPVDFLLGRERTARSKVVKQPDVLMLVALLWDRFPQAVREANYRYYKPRTSDGSSLSPPIHALLAARLGEGEAALASFEQTVAIDLEDTMGNSAGGVHVGAQGGLWQAVVLGFAGVRLIERGLAFAPALPARWSALRFPLVWHGLRIHVAIERDPPTIELASSGEGAILIALEEGEVQLLRAGARHVARRGRSGWGAWEEKPHET